MSESERYNDPQRWYSTNLIGIPSWLLASVEFNDHPQRLRIAGARETHRGLFRLLEEALTPQDAEEKFRRYLDIVFELQRSRYELGHARQRRFRPSYLKLIEGWSFDANSPQGAVLKGWVESRFGLAPNFHRVPLGRYPSPAWMEYLEQKYSSRFHSNSIHMQLDLLYEFCQFVANRFGLPPGEQVTLWRGVNMVDEPAFAGGGLRKGVSVVRLNNLVSFTTCRERAEEFGDWILEAQVPVAKLLFFPGLLSTSLLSGEGEVLALGGHYRVLASYA